MIPMYFLTIPVLIFSVLNFALDSPTSPHWQRWCSLGVKRTSRRQEVQNSGRVTNLHKYRQGHAARTDCHRFALIFQILIYLKFLSMFHLDIDCHSSSWIVISSHQRILISSRLFSPAPSGSPCLSRCPSPLSCCPRKTRSPCDCWSPQMESPMCQSPPSPVAVV